MKSAVSLNNSVVRWNSTDISEEQMASIFGVGEWAEQETSARVGCDVGRFPTGFVMTAVETLRSYTGDTRVLSSTSWCRPALEVARRYNFRRKNVKVAERPSCLSSRPQQWVTNPVPMWWVCAERVWYPQRIDPLVIYRRYFNCCV